MADRQRLPLPLGCRYINRFRTASKLQAEAGYYLSSLVRPCLPYKHAFAAPDSRFTSHPDRYHHLYREHGLHESLQHHEGGL